MTIYIYSHPIIKPMLSYFELALKEHFKIEYVTKITKKIHNGIKIFVHYNPIQMIDLLEEYRKNEELTKTNYRFDRIKQHTGYSLNTYEDLEKSVLDYCLWFETIKSVEMNYIVKLEDPSNFIKELNIPYPNKIWPSYYTQNNYKELNIGTYSLLVKILNEYGYSSLVKTI